MFTVTPTPYDRSGPADDNPGDDQARNDPTGSDPGEYRNSTHAYTDPSIYPGTPEGAGPGAYEPPAYSDYAYPESPRSEAPHSEPSQPGSAYPSAPGPYQQSGYPQSAYPQSGYPQPGYPQSAYPQSYPPPGRRQGRDKSVMIVLICIAVLVIIGLLIVGAYFLLNRSSDSTTDTEATPTVTQTVNPPQTSTVTVGPATPPPGAVSCGAGVSAGTSVTSCSFAQAVRDEYLRTGVQGQARVISAYSPVTGLSYVMSCGPEGGVVACRGGNDAVVYVY